MTEPQNEAVRDEYAEAAERMHVCNEARARLGLPKQNAITKGNVKLSEPLPRFARLVIGIRAAFLGWDHPNVEHMVERNEQLDLWRAVEGMA